MGSGLGLGAGFSGFSIFVLCSFGGLLGEGNRGSEGLRGATFWYRGVDRGSALFHVFLGLLEMVQIAWSVAC